jgi:HSP20 family protein
MSLLPRSFITEPATSFTPLFRLLEDFDTYQTGRHSQRTGTMKTFNPKFDVKENSDSYELHGELPGIEQKNVEIEFTDIQTISIKGRTEHSYTSGTQPAIESSKVAGTITEGTEAKNNHKATVEDEGAVAGVEKSEQAEVVKAPESSKFWVSERSQGEFSRSFTFPVRVDQDAVSASMKNGILSIVVPKSKKHESRKINIA